MSLMSLFNCVSPIFLCKKETDPFLVTQWVIFLLFFIYFVDFHKLGGHGALICALKRPELFKVIIIIYFILFYFILFYFFFFFFISLLISTQSVSAFAPISNPINCPWGQKAFKGYLGENQESWKSYDATELVKNYEGHELNIFIDVKYYFFIFLFFYFFIFYFYFIF